jgi:methylenetetrahydrofolate dehydrogenase (NADP+)/methenyltetrahydrofolate cyclohydrolase
LSAKVMDGNIVAEAIRTKVRARVAALNSQHVEPKLATVLIGDSPGSKAYVSSIEKSCNDVCIGFQKVELPKSASQKQLEDNLRALSGDESVTGLLLELPLPIGLDDFSALSIIPPQKDVDGLTPQNLGRLLQRRGELIPCTPRAVVALLKYYGIKISGSHAVIINRSKPVGRPLSQLLLDLDATVTVCHSKTRGLGDISRQADILISGIGHRSVFTVGPGMVKSGAAVVDVGISSVDGKLMGDVDFGSVASVAGFLTPVPGGVGPVTISMLLYNTVLAACLQSKQEIGFNPDELGSSESL